MYRYLVFLSLLTFQIAFTQEIKWEKFDDTNSGLANLSVKAIAIDTSGAVWIGTYNGGIAVYDHGNWEIFSTENSGLPHNYINAVAIDNNNVKWIGTDGGGLVKYDGQEWTVYKTSNSGLPSNVIMDIYCDEDSIIWIGTYFGGLVKYDGTNWEVFNKDNSALMSNKVVAIAKDKKGLIWAGTQGGGVASYDGISWRVYTTNNSKLPNDYIYSVAVDEDNTKWIGTGGGGIAVFDDTQWKIYNTDNSGLTDNNIRPIAIGIENVKWIGTYIGGINVFDGNQWSNYDFQNSPLPDDEITTMAVDGPEIFIGTERSGLVIADDELHIPPVAPLAIESGHVTIPGSDTAKTTSSGEETINPQMFDLPSGNNKILMLFDAADIKFDPDRLKKIVRSFKIILDRRERVDASYSISLLIYTSNADINPESVVLTEGQKKNLHSPTILYLDGENDFVEALKKSYQILKNEFDPGGNNNIIAATYKFIRNSDEAKAVIQDHLDNDYIIFSLIAFNTDTWKMEYKVRDMIPKGNGHYYPVNPPTWMDNWSVTAQSGMSWFLGDNDVSNKISFPGIYGFAINKQVMSDGIINGGVKAQFNIGKLQGEKKNHSFKNNYIEGLINFQVILNRWFNNNFKFEKFRPYGFAGIGLIAYRTLLRDENGNVVYGFGYDIVQGKPEINGTDPAKTNREIDIMFPVGAGVNYKINDKFNIELEGSTRFIQSDKLDGRVSQKNDKYLFISLGLTYKIRSKDFLHDVLNK